MRFDIEYEKEIDFQHIDDINEAGRKFSEITNLLNRVLFVRQHAKKAILEECSTWTGEKLFKLSWDNKLVRLAELSGSSDLTNLWQDADVAYRRIRIKQAQLLEDILLLKKTIEILPR